MKLIDKDVLIVEIDRRIKETESMQHKFDQFGAGQISAFKGVLKILDTFEVKEAVDAEIVEVEDNNYSMYAYTHLEISTDEDLSKICKAGDKAKVIIIKQK